MACVKIYLQIHIGQEILQQIEVHSVLPHLYACDWQFGTSFYFSDPLTSGHPSTPINASQRREADP